METVSGLTVGEAPDRPLARVGGVPSVLGGGPSSVRRRGRSMTRSGRNRASAPTRRSSARSRAGGAGRDSCLCAREAWARGAHTCSKPGGLWRVGWEMPAPG